jgi:hypothetical protein
MPRKKGSRKKIFKGELEIDHQRGVIYFHLTGKRDIKTTETMSLLRICSLPQIPFPLRDILDITHLRGCNWGPIPDDFFAIKGRAIPLPASSLERKEAVTKTTEVDPLTEKIKKRVRMR